MTEESPHPDEAIATLLDADVPEAVREHLTRARGGDYQARCLALLRALEALPAEARNAMTAEQLSILSLGASAAEATDTGR